MENTSSSLKSKTLKKSLKENLAEKAGSIERDVTTDRPGINTTELVTGFRNFEGFMNGKRQCLFPHQQGILFFLT